MHKEFENVCSLKVIENKTEALPSGNGKGFKCKNINWVKTTTKVLGIKIGNNKQELIEENFEGTLAKLKTRLNIWRQWNLSWLEKSLIIKSLGISQLVYLLSHIRSPGTEFLKNAEAVLFDFVWKGGPDGVKRKTLETVYELGGLDLP